MAGSGDCLFCKIAAGEIPSDRVYEDESAVAFRDIHPAAPVHVLVIPRQHIVSLAKASPEELAVAGGLISVIHRVAQGLGLKETGYRVVSNAGALAGQTVDHLHWHILSGRPLAWPPG